MLRSLSGNRVYTTIVAVWLTLSVASVLLSAVTWWRLYQEIAEARLTAGIHGEVDAILKLLLDVETSQRGFTITGNEAFLVPLEGSGPQLTMRFDALTELARGEKGLLDQVVELSRQAGLLINHHHRIVKVRREEGATAAAAIIAEGEGKRQMDQCREIVNRVKTQHGTIITDGGEGQRSQVLRAIVTSLVAGIIGIGAGILAFFLAVLAIRHQQRERELVEAKFEAERSSHEKTVFLANMSHEIRTPMNSILGFCELLQGELRQAKHQNYVKAISTSGHSLLQLINDILDMSKIEAGVLELKEEPTDPREICDFIKTVFAEPASRKNVKLECQVAEDLPRAFLLDRIRLRQVLVNLVGNAVKFTEKGSITVRVNWEKGDRNSRITLLIEVQDTGVGIPKARMETIFKPFVQAGFHREKERQGTGLGLSIVKRLTEMMGGQVTAASVPGEGSAFSLRFPNVHVSARLPVSEKLESGAPADFSELRSAHLLVVDDNEANCQLVEGLFADSHHRLDFAHDGREAVRKADELRPDVILMDVRMPGMDGRQALMEIRNINGMEMTPVIAVTASTLMSEEGELMKKFDGYIRKPFTKRELFDELAQFLPREDTPIREGLGDTVDGARANPPVPSELIVELRRLHADSWIGLQESPAINDCRSFAETLSELARDYNSPPLAYYGRILARDAANYSVDDLENHLREFPGLIDRLENHSIA